MIEKKKNYYTLLKKNIKRVISEVLRKIANQMQYNITVRTLTSTFTKFTLYSRGNKRFKYNFR